MYFTFISFDFLEFTFSFMLYSFTVVPSSDCKIQVSLCLKSMVLWCKVTGTTDHKKIRSPSLIRLVAALLDSLRTSHRRDFKPDMKVLLNLMNMGFKEEDICDALYVMGNNQSAAVSIVSCLYSSSNLYKFYLCY